LPVEHRDDPVLVGGVGGSGTRAFSKVLRQAGIHMGGVYETDDAVAFSRFYERFLVAYLEGGGRFPPHCRGVAERAFDAALREHLSSLPSPEALWGAKNPRSILMLPFWHEHYPRLRFIHVVRNGLDMTYSDDQFQSTSFGTFVLGEEADRSQPERSIRYWAEINRRAARFGESHLDGRYIRIRYEDLCLDTERTVARLFEFLGIDDPARMRAGADQVSPALSIGRWRHQPSEELAALAEAGGDALRWLGYWTAELDRRVTPSGSRTRPSLRP
jgi:hypothetical protein